MRIGRAAGVTDTGRRRLRNEDAFVCEPPLFAVTDGMGGARAGQLAAELAATVLEEGASEIDDVDALVHAVEEANRRIWERSVSDPETTGMGAVATVALVRDGMVAIGHVGDSRAYLIRGGAIEQLTTGPLPRRRACRERRPDARGSGASPAALGDHESARDGARGRGRRAHRRGGAG